RSMLFIFFEKHLGDQNLSHSKQNLIYIIYKILKEENIDNLYELDSLNLIFSNWHNDDNRNTSLIAKQNYLLLNFYENNGSFDIDFDAIVDAAFLVLYADFYEASLVCENQVFRPIFKNIVDNLNKNISCLLEDSFEILTNLWFIIPQKIFTERLEQQLDPEIIKTVATLKSNEDFIEEKITANNLLKQDIEEIKKSLEEQKTEYNFVGLSNGFSKLRETKESELKTEKETYRNLMFTIIAIIFIKTIGSLIYLWTNDPINLIFIAITVATIFFLFILLYFFRISLVNIKSIKSQILQIDLRLTLCQFIHNYETDTTKLRSKDMKESFDRFESVIFAPIVATEDQMPSTFDGIEQLTGLLSSFNRGSK
ncbi:hypothetical protein ACTXP0_03590, partial [Psychrobacter celer]